MDDTTPGFERPAEQRSKVDEALYMAYDAVSVSPETIYTYLKERFGVPVKEPADVYQVPLETLDLSADDFVRAGKVDGAVQGGFLGSGGVLSIPLDLLGIISQSVRLSQKIAINYGFGVRSEEEKAAIWVVLAQATGVTTVADGPSTLLVTTMPSLVKNSPYKRVIVFKLLREVVKQLELKLGRRALGRVIPLVGTAFGAISNFRLLEKVGQSAKAYFRARHLHERQNKLTE